MKLILTTIILRVAYGLKINALYIVCLICETNNNNNFNKKRFAPWKN